MKQLWFQELDEKHGLGLSFQLKQTLYKEKSPFQDIAIVETEGFGRMLILDGCVMTTEKDEFVYHEMLVHPAMCAHPNPEKVLVIGGGDGGTVRELLRHPGVSIDMVEIDELVVRACQKYMPTLSCGLEDPRVRLLFEDGVAFLENNKDTYDLIFIDSTDPVGMAEGLITQSFYNKCKEALKAPGAIVLQSESPTLHTKEIQRIHQNLSEVFSSQQLYLAPIVSYPSGLWSFTFASDNLHPQGDFIPEKATSIVSELSYYNEDIHKSAFSLPNFVKKLLPTYK